METFGVFDIIKSFFTQFFGQFFNRFGQEFAYRSREFMYQPSVKNGLSVGIIGGADGLTSIFVSGMDFTRFIMFFAAFLAVWFIAAVIITALVTYFMVKKHKSKDAYSEKSPEEK